MKKLTNKEWNNINRAYELSYICDTVADIASLPTEDVAAGSLALVVGEGDAYLFSASGEWKKFGKQWG